MREIVVDQGWREVVRELAARRKDVWPLLALAAAAVLIAFMLTGRSAPAQVAPPAQAAPSPSPSVPQEISGPGLLVHVAGAVMEPGLYEFPPGARVADAVETAGGPRRRADLDALNLAEALVDGTKVEVPKVGEVATTSTTSGSSEAGAMIPINTADQTLLETIPGVGPVTATAILTYREEIGSFSSLEQLLEVDGIGPATFDSIRSYVTL